MYGKLLLLSACRTALAEDPASKSETVMSEHRGRGDPEAMRDQGHEWLSM